MGLFRSAGFMFDTPEVTFQTVMKQDLSHCGRRIQFKHTYKIQLGVTSCHPGILQSNQLETVANMAGEQHGGFHFPETLNKT